MKTNKLVAIVVVVLLLAIGGVFALAANSKGSTKTSTATNTMPSSSSTSSTPSTTSAAAATVKIQDYMFEPMATTVKVGDTVTWTNMDSVHHNVIADNASADAPNGPLLAKGESYSFTFKKAGSYAFHCAPHTYMHGTVVVQ